MSIFVQDFQIPQSKPQDINFNPGSSLVLALVLLLTSASILAIARYGAVLIMPANGLLLALMLTSPARRGMVYLVLGLSAYAVSAAVIGLPMIVCLRIAVVSGVELLISRALLQRYITQDTDLSKPEYLWRFVLFAVVVAPAIATLSATILKIMAGGRLEWLPLFSLFLGHGLGILTITPVALEARRNVLKLVRSVTSTPSVIAFAVLTAICVLVFWQTQYPVLYLVFPPLVGVIVLAGLAGGSLGLFLIAVIAFAFTIGQHGPMQLMADAPTVQKIVLLQLFIGTAGVLTLTLGAALAERDRAEAALRAICGDHENPATVDSLTGLFNRRRLDEFFDHEFGRAVAQGNPLSLLMLDIDLFRSFNDQYGDLAGDSCLRAIGELLRDLCRNQGDFAARSGGEEFVIVLGGDAPAALMMAEAVRTGIWKLRIRHAGNTEHGNLVTVSIGINTLLPRLREGSADAMRRETEALLYEAKRTGRNRIVSPAQMPTDPVAPLLANEADRLTKVVRVLREMRAPLRADLQGLAAEAATLFQTPIAAVTLVSQDRQTFAGSVGLEDEYTGLDVSFCSHAITGTLPLVVTNATRDPRFAENKAVTGAPHLRFYAGAPIISMGGYALGSLCAASDEPRDTPSELELRRLSQLAARAGALIERQIAGDS